MRRGITRGVEGESLNWRPMVDRQHRLQTAKGSALRHYMSFLTRHEHEFVQCTHCIQHYLLLQSSASASQATETIPRADPWVSKVLVRQGTILLLVHFLDQWCTYIFSEHEVLGHIVSLR